MSNETHTPTADLLAELNVLRAGRDQSPLKSWKGSRTALLQTVTAYQVKKVAPAVAEGAYDTSTKAEASTEIKGTHERKREAIRKANAPKSGDLVKGAKDHPAFKLTTSKQNKAKAPTSKSSEFVSLADIARELGIEPKLARAKARRNDELTKLAQGDAWAFKPADVAAVKKLLK